MHVRTIVAGGIAIGLLGSLASLAGLIFSLTGVSVLPHWLFWLALTVLFAGLFLSSVAQANTDRERERRGQEHG